MSSPYTILDHLPSQIDDIPADSIVSKTLYQDSDLKTILFGFAPGQELSEHTASVPALLYFLDGEADLVLGEDQCQAGPGTWVHMPPQLPHSISARTEVTMLLIMLEKK